MMELAVGLTLISTIVILIFDYIWRTRTFHFRSGLAAAILVWIALVIVFIYLSVL